MAKKILYYKTKEEIELIRESCMLVSKSLAEVAKHIRPGVTTISLDKIAFEFIKDNKAVPAFLNYNGFPNSLCISVNAQVVHGIPGNYELKDGDIVSVDCGVVKNEFYGDSAFTFPVGNVKQEILDLLKTTRESLYKGIENAVVGKRVGDIASAIQTHCEKKGYTVVRELVGHGLGRSLHEEPEVPNFGKAGNGMKLEEGLVIAIEPMINLGVRNVDTMADNWTIITRDNKPSAHFEHTIAIGKQKADILSSFDVIDEVLKAHGVYASI